MADGTVVLFETSLGSLGSVTVTKATGNGVATATLTSQVPGHCNDHGHVGFQRQFLIDLLLVTH